MPRTFLFVLLLFIACNLYAGKIAESVTIFELYANPEKYSGQLIMFHGFLGDTSARAAIFPTEDYARIADISSRIFITDQAAKSEIFENCEWSYIVIVGKFEYTAPNFARTVTKVRSARGFGEYDRDSGALEMTPCFYSQ